MIESRYPYTYAADYIRTLLYKESGRIIPRSEASYNIRMIATMGGYDAEFVAEELAYRYLMGEDGTIEEDK